MDISKNQWRSTGGKCANAEASICCNISVMSMCCKVCQCWNIPVWKCSQAKTSLCQDLMQKNHRDEMSICQNVCEPKFTHDEMSSRWNVLAKMSSGAELSPSKSMLKAAQFNPQNESLLTEDFFYHVQGQIFFWRKLITLTKIVNTPVSQPPSRLTLLWRLAIMTAAERPIGL